MKFSILGSGSSGNSSYIEMGKKKFLIDAGFSGKKIAEKLNNIGRRIEDIDGVFVTHEHSDHIQGLGVISRKYDIPIYLHEITYGIIREKIGKIDPKNINFLRKNNQLELGDLKNIKLKINKPGAPIKYHFKKCGVEVKLSREEFYNL